MQVKQPPILKPVPDWMICPVPHIELLKVILFMKQNLRVKGLFSHLTLMVLFTAFTVSLVYFSDYIPRSSCGVFAQMPLTVHIILNVLKIAIVLAGIYLEKQTRIIDHYKLNTIGNS